MASAFAHVGLRVVWGLARNRHGRCAQFVGAPRRLGHNPLGAWMSLALLRCVAAWCVTGWLCTADAPSGDMTVRQRENLVCSMLKGENRAPRDDDVV